MHGLRVIEVRGEFQVICNPPGRRFDEWEVLYRHRDHERAHDFLQTVWPCWIMGWNEAKHGRLGDNWAPHLSLVDLWIIRVNPRFPWGGVKVFSGITEGDAAAAFKGLQRAMTIGAKDYLYDRERKPGE